MPDGRGHIFLSHSGADTQAARQFAETLRRNGLEIWFDKDSLQPGDHWRMVLEEAIQKASAMVVYVGSLGVQSWVDREVQFGLDRNTTDPKSFRLIPVLGAGANPAALSPFLTQQEWIDLRDPQHAPEQIRRLVETLKNEPSSSASQSAIPSDYWISHSPFRALQTFEPEDSWLFFGRDSDIDELLSRLGRAPVLAVLGNSGSGKSSLIRAGLIPALHRGRFCRNGAWVDSWQVALVRPSQAPFDYLADFLPSQLAPTMSATERDEYIERLRIKLPHNMDALRNALANLIDSNRQKGRILLVVDQFEELFTLTPEKDRAIRNAYIDLLLSASLRDGVHLVLALRADYYAHCLEHPELSRCFEANLYNIRRMSEEQLRASIEKRLALAAFHAEPGLTDSLLTDVGAQPGNLALLEHAIGQLWEKDRVSGKLTNQTYSEIGRLRGALGRHADEIYNQIGNEDEKRLTQKIFLELIQIGEGAEDTRRRRDKEFLLELGPPEQVERLLVYLASARLIIAGQQGGRDFVEVSHDAVILGWPKLRDWLRQNRDDLRFGRRLLESAEEWHRLNRDSGALLRGARLAQIQEWLNRDSAPQRVREFVRVSVEKASQEQAAERRRAIQLRRLSFVLAVLLVVATSALFFARGQKVIAESRALAFQAEHKLPQDPPAAFNLAMRAWQSANTPEAHLAVTESIIHTLSRLEGHTGIVLSAIFSPDGRIILTASEDGTARIWSALNGQAQATLSGHAGPVISAIFSPDGQHILTASGDHTARVWDVNGQLLTNLQGHTGTVRSAVFSPDGQRILTASDDSTARVWNAVNGQVLVILKGHAAGVLTAVFSPDGQRILTASSDHTARIWDASGQLLTTLQGHTSNVNSAVFSPDGRHILTVSFDKTAALWDAPNGRLLAILQGHTNNVSKGVFSPDGQTILTASYDKTARMWNAADGKPLIILQGHTDRVLSAVFSRDGKLILTASADKTARVWNASGGQLVATLQGHTEHVQRAVFSADGQHILTASADNTARIWNGTSTQMLTTTLEGHDAEVVSAVFSQNDQRILTASSDKTSRVWSANSGQLLLTLKGHTDRVLNVAVSPDGQRILTASADKTARVWNASSGQLLITLKGHTNQVLTAAFSPHGQQILTASADKTARVWDAANGQLLVTLQGHTDRVLSAAFSPDGQQILTASDTTARVWNAISGQLLIALRGHNDRVLSAVFSPDGKLILTASFDQTARIWNAANGQLLVTLHGHSGAVRSAIFCRDGRRILTSSDDKTARVWDAASGQLLATLQGHTDRVLSAVFSSDCQFILTGGADYTARVFRTVPISEIADLLAK